VASPTNDRLVRRLLVTGGLAVFLVAGGYAIVSALDRTETSSATSTSPTTTPKPAAPKVRLVRVPLTPVGALDPEGDRRENDQEAPLAVDGNATTAWHTESYDQFFKKGVGLVLDAGANRRLGQVVVVTGTPGVTAEIRAGGAAEGPFRTVAEGQVLDPTTTFRLKGARGRYIVVWITAIPGGGAAEIAEARLRILKTQ
jgi:hypothetical protein